MDDPTIPELVAWCRQKAEMGDALATREICAARLGWPVRAQAHTGEADNLRAIAAALERAERLEATAANNAALRHALTLALEYWSHRQQRYKNRHPAWVVAARAAAKEPDHA